MSRHDRLFIRYRLVGVSRSTSEEAWSREVDDDRRALVPAKATVPKQGPSFGLEELSDAIGLTLPARFMLLYDALTTYRNNALHECHRVLLSAPRRRDGRGVCSTEQMSPWRQERTSAKGCG